LDSVARPSLVTFTLPILSKLANIGFLLASGIGVAVTNVLAIPLLGRAVLLVGPWTLDILGFIGTHGYFRQDFSSFQTYLLDSGFPSLSLGQ